jgi:hypothetical protein
MTVFLYAFVDLFHDCGVQFGRRLTASHLNATVYTDDTKTLDMFFGTGTAPYNIDF